MELKSEKTRNLIGKIPPITIRFGNIFIIFFLFVLILLGIFIKIPNIQYGKVKIRHGNEDYQLELYLKEVNHVIHKGNKIRIYKEGFLLHQSTIPYTIEKMYLKDNYYFVPLKIKLPSFTNNGILLEVDNNTLLTIEIETKRESIIKYLNIL